MRDLRKVVFETAYDLKHQYNDCCKKHGEFSNEAEDARRAFCTVYSIIESCGSDMELEYFAYKYKRIELETEGANA